MPQIAQIGEIFASQLFWLTVFFGLTFVVVGLGMLPKIQSTVDARDSRIAADLQQAQAARETAGRLEEGYRERMDRSRSEAARLASEAKAAAARATEERVAAADQGINAQLEEAQARIGSARSAAAAEIEAVAAEAAQAMAERVAGLRLDAETVRGAVRQELVHG